MKIVICPDSFKGSLSSTEAADAVVCGAKIGAGLERIETVTIPLADGGEGTVEALVRATGGEVRTVCISDPLLRKTEAFYGLLGDGKTAAIEMAAASGLYLLSESERNPLITSTYGTGELIMAAVEAGAEKLVIGIGGSATNDCGAGAMSALGAKFLDENDEQLPPGGAMLSRLCRIDMSSFKFPLDRVSVEAACDVNNPLCGELGASAVFGPQKGATQEMVSELDLALANCARVINRDLRKDIINMPGAGAAGGLGAALAAFLNAKLRSGIDMVLDAAHFDDVIANADLIITGEGRIDEQTAYGKTIGGVLKRAAKLGVPVVAIAGSVAGDVQVLYDAGLVSAFSITPGPVSLEMAMENAADYIKALSANIIRLAIESRSLS